MKRLCILIMGLLFTAGCGPSAEVIATQTVTAATAIAASWTPTPTNTPTETPLPTNTPAPTPTRTPKPTPTPFSISDQGFEADFQDDCNTDVEITAVEGDSFSARGIISTRNDRFALWCYGAKHTWIGALSYAGYTFTSEASDPLQFRLDKNKGYVHIGGKGAVSLPDGTVVKFGK
jgi:hypothetical protein